MKIHIVKSGLLFGLKVGLIVGLAWGAFLALFIYILEITIKPYPCVLIIGLLLGVVIGAYVFANCIRLDGFFSSLLTWIIIILSACLSTVGTFLFFNYVLF